MAHLPSEAQARKNLPLARGLLDYFPDALCAVADLSRVGNDQHNPGQPLHWAKEKSTDEADALMRHLIDRGKTDSDGVRHSAKVAWRALAMLQREIEAENVREQANLDAALRPGKVIHVEQGAQRAYCLPITGPGVVCSRLRPCPLHDPVPCNT